MTTPSRPAATKEVRTYIHDQCLLQNQFCCDEQIAISSGPTPQSGDCLLHNQHPKQTAQIRSRFTHVMRVAGKLLAIGGLMTVSQGCPDIESHGSLYQNAGQAFEGCNSSEIQWLAKKHNMMGAFKYCGSNHFRNYAWSPTGELLFFDLPTTANLMDAGKKNKPLYRIPINPPMGQSTWLNQQKIAFPQGASATDEDRQSRIGIFDTFQHTLDYRETDGISDLDELQSGQDVSTVYFTGSDKDGTRSIYKLDVDDGSITTAFPWYEGLVDTFTYTPEADTVVVGTGGTVRAYKGATGKPLGEWSPAIRGVMHPDGTWLALEHEGEEVSVFYQRRWEKQKGRDWAQEKQRVSNLEKNLPSWYNPKVRLPTVSFVEIATDKRWAVTSFYGEKFSWYPPINKRAKYFGSYILWGFEGKQLNRNVILGDMTMLISAMKSADTSAEIQLMEPQKASEPKVEPEASKTPIEGDSEKNVPDAKTP